MLNIEISRDFQAKKRRDAAAAAAGEKAADLVFSARARAYREKRNRRIIGALAVLAAPALALKIHGSAGPAPVRAPEDAQMAAVSLPATALPHIVTQRGPAQAKVAREGIDFTATSATGGDTAPGAPTAAPKPHVKKTKRQLPK
jgi:hypothetical protein